LKIEQHEEDKIDRERRNRIKQEFEDREAELRRLRQQVEILSEKERLEIIAREKLERERIIREE